MFIPRVLTTLLLLSACRAEPALVVEEVAFPPDAVEGLPPELREQLVDLASVGWTIARGEEQELFRPLYERAAERGRLDALPLALAAREEGYDDGALRQVYARDPEWELTVRHIVRLLPEWAAEAERREARRLLETVRERAQEGEDFAALAAEYSEEPGAAERGGRLEPGREGSWVPPFWEAARGLQPGEVSPMVETRYGLHLIQLEARRPVPWEEAGRARVLSRLVSPAQGQAALGRWVTERFSGYAVDAGALDAALERLRRGEAPRGVPLVHWAGGAYTDLDLSVAWAALEPEERGELEGERLRGWAENDAWRSALARSAAELGLRADADAGEMEEREWTGRLERWAGALEVRPGAEVETVSAGALRALGSRGQEAQILRMELELLRPLLRARYFVSGPASPPSAAASSSETRKSESTR